MHKGNCQAHTGLSSGSPSHTARLIDDYSPFSGAEEGGVTSDEEGASPDESDDEDERTEAPTATSKSASVDAVWEEADAGVARRHGSQETVLFSGGGGVTSRRAAQPRPGTRAEAADGRNRRPICNCRVLSWQNGRASRTRAAGLHFLSLQKQ